jgi:hypothetical protein
VKGDQFLDEIDKELVKKREKKRELETEQDESLGLC